MKEIISLRKPREKHFLNEDGTFTVQMYDHDIHYLENGEYKEIDNSLIELDSCYQTSSNAFIVSFAKQKNQELLKIEKDNHYLKFFLNTSQTFKLLTQKYSITYQYILKDIDIKYSLKNNQIKDTIWINKPTEDLPKIKYIIETDLKLILKNNSIFIYDGDKFISKIEPPTLMDSQKNKYNIGYNLVESESGYVLTFKFDSNIFHNRELYPFIIDPTITNSEEKTVYDTYIYSGEENKNYNLEDSLHVGVNESNKIYRSLIKFALPTIGTGCEIFDATASLVSHVSDFVALNSIYTHQTLEAHQINTEWNEESATWNTMHNKYNEHIEDYFQAYKTEYDAPNNTYNLKTTSFNITNIVKKWYAGEANNGVLLKLEDEIYGENSEHTFYSKNNTITETNDDIEDPKPYLIIRYKNFNGLEDYMTYQTIDFQNGKGYVNNLTGNLTTVFHVNQTIGGKFPVNLNLIYNSNDAVLKKNIGLGLGYRWNFSQTIEEITIGEEPYLAYIDADGTTHYFYQSDEHTYQDEDGLNLTISKDNSTYVMTDAYKNKKIFEKKENTYYLVKMVDTYQNEVHLEYGENNRLIKITDANNETINISYGIIKITTTSSYTTSTLNRPLIKITDLITKTGTTVFSYNSSNLIDNITDENGLKTEFDYYNNSPYRMKKITEKSLQDTTGNSLEFFYSFLVTKVVNQKNQILTYAFNEQGNTISVTNLDESLDLKNAYGTENIYVQNKLALNIPLTKYVKNLFEDPSFENKTGTIIYNVGVIDTTNARSGQKCVRTNGYEIEIPLPMVETAGYYTFSGYFKHTSAMEISLHSSSASITETKHYLKADEYQRYFLTAHLEANTPYYINVFPVNNATIYMDDFQFESGQVANYFNLINNSDFSNGMEGYESAVFSLSGEEVVNDDSVVTIANNQKAYQMNCKSKLSKSLTKRLNIEGKKGDTYRLSFWYKNEGLREGTMASGNIALLGFSYKVEVPHGVPTYGLNCHATEWQYFERIIVAEEDYSSILLSIMAQFNVNKLYITNLYLVKDFGGSSYTYDENGNLISATDTSNSTNTFQYDSNNQLVSNFSPKGNHFQFEYDNNDPEQLRQGISSKGIANRLYYDENGNPIQTIIKNVKNIKDFTKEYFYIRKKATDKYLFSDFHGNIPVLKDFECNLSKFQLESDEDNYYYIKTDLMPYYFAYRENISEKVVLTKNKEEASLFELIENKNGSYTLRIKKVYANDSGELTYDACISFDENDSLIIENYIMDNPDQELFFESAETPLYIESKAIYQNNGKFISKTIDALDKVTTYDINEITGLTNSITDPSQTTTYYEYNQKEQISKIKKNEKEILYAYNTQNLLEKITSNNKEYTFTYDEFLNRLQTKINNQILATNNYDENNGGLTRIDYGNNTFISYTYDEFNRLKTNTRDDSIYSYYYDNMNNLSKITSNNETYEYSYDFAGRLISYLYNQKDYFTGKNSIDYEYDINSNVTKKSLNNLIVTEYEYDEDDEIVKVTIGDINLNYQRDYLGRLTSKNINNQLPVEYTYYTNGNKTSLILKSMKIEDDLYEYYYDDVYNLSKVFKNHSLLYEYQYDAFHELLSEHNYETKRTYRYAYDGSGNILSKKEYELNTSNLLHEDTYTYNNTTWEDQLTKFNDTSITYDEIGNPISIGNMTLSWKNGRELKSLIADNLNVNYFYNKDGIRRKKTVNNVETEYFTENGAILIEKSGNNVIYYLRDDNNNLLGFMYNGTTYYYQKNLQEDIIGIYNNNYELIAKYQYDAWGKLLKITNASGEEITDTNHIAYINPYRYRSYYYDSETKLYYLNSRYYNPEWGRFINADGIIGTDDTNTGYNLYAYVLNRPIDMKDSSGQFALEIIFGKEILAAGALLFAGALYLAQNPQVVKSAVRSIENFATNTLDSIKEGVQTITSSRSSLKEKNYAVYILYNKKEERVDYVGRTSNAEAREAAHKNNPDKKHLEMHVVERDLPYGVARWREQELIVKYKTLNSGYLGCNKINGINPLDREKFEHYRNEAMQYYEETYVGGIIW